MQNNNEKKVTDSTLHELTSAIKESQWNSDIKIKLIQDFLGVDSFDKTCNFSEVLSNYERRVIGAVFENFLKIHNYKIIKSFYSDNKDLYPFEYENIDIEYKKSKKVPNNGTMLIENENAKLILTFDYYTPDSSKLDITSLKENSKTAEKFFEDLKEHAKANNYLKNKKITPDLKFIEQKNNYTWSSVILEEKTKEKLMKNLNVILKNMDIYRQNNIPFKRGIILKGLPGLGKTLIGKVLTNLENFTMIWVTPKHLERSSNIATIGEMARELSPTILFLEDIDLYGESREMSHHKTLLGELMNQLDGIEENKNVIVIATTNRGDELEKALRNRPGRFDIVIEIKKPEIIERKAMLNLYISKFQSEKLDIEEIAEKTEKYTGAHIKDLVDLAVMTAIDENSLDENKKIILKQKHFLSNIKRVGEKKIEISDAFNSKSKASNFPFIDDYPDD